ncbi:hypothetical protein IFR05_004070 [Cadophora sp. M221]|nr:hypothetical protein IFR05_004070 [Cadophora sp. M221]
MDQEALQPETNMESSGEISRSSGIRDEMEQTPTTTVPQSTYSIAPQPTRTCQWAGCAEKRVFQQESAFRRHMNKHERPYKCPTANCKAKDFTNSGDLKRHQRTVHSKGLFFCPVSSCKRYAKGFGRKDNREEHVKRVHSPEASMTLNSPGEQGMGFHGVGNNVGEIGSPVSDENIPDVEALSLRSPSFANSKVSLATKLQELKDAKAAAIAEVAAKFDKDIDAVERVLSLT